MKRILNPLFIAFMFVSVFTSCEDDETTYNPLSFPQDAFVAFEESGAISTAENNPATVEIIVNYANSSEAATSDVAVNFTIASDNAVEGVDYTVDGSSSQLNFPVGTFNRTIAITPINNALSDGNKVLTITLTSSNGPQIGYPGTEPSNTVITLTILDDDCAFTLAQFDGYTWSGEDDAPAPEGPNATQIVTTFDGTNLYMEGIAYGWLTNTAYWDEVVVTSNPVLANMDPATGVFTIALQPLCETTWIGAPQPAYSISAEGQYFPCLEEMVVNYTLYQSGAVLREFTETIN